MKQVSVSVALSGVYFKANSGIEILNEYEGESGQFLKTFAINDKRNKNGWKAIWEGIKKNIDTFKGKPGIEFIKCDKDGCDLDHTEAQTEELSLKVQEPFRVTTIVGFTFDESTHTAYFIDKVNDPNFFEKVKKGKIKFVSPSIWPKSGGYEIVGEMENGQPMIDVWDWNGLHKAYVNKPAFGDDAKITATCEGHDCPVKLLTASEKKVHLVADAVQDCVTKKVKDYGQSPDEQKLAIFYSECRKNLSSTIANDDNLSHLQEIPLLITHNKKRRFFSVNQNVLQAVQKLLDKGKSVDDSTLFNIVRKTDRENSSFKSCTCSTDHLMDEQEEKDLKSKLKALEEDKKDLESKLHAQDTDEEKEKQAKARTARLVAIFNAMEHEDDREKVAKAIRATDDENEKKALDEAEKEIKSKSKVGQTDEEKEKEARIANLESTIAQPLVAKMVEARESKGASEDDINKFTKSLEGKSLQAIEEKYESEKIFVEGELSATEEQLTEQKHFSFNATDTKALSGKSLEEIFEEVIA